MKTLLLICLTLSTLHVHANVIFPTKEIKDFIQLTPSDQLSELKALNIRIIKFKDKTKSDYSSNIIPLVEYFSTDDDKKFKHFIDDSILGIFLTKHNSYYNVQVDTIIVSEAADDWTVYHELAHALLDRTRQAVHSHEEGRTFMTLEDAYDDYEESIHFYKTYGRFSSISSRNYAYQTVKTWLTIYLNHLSTFELEEVIIEKNLRSIYSDLKMNIDILERSLRYEKNNCNTAKDKISHSQAVFSQFTDFLGLEGRMEFNEDILEFKNFIETKESLFKRVCN